MVLFPALIVLTVAFPTQGAVFYTNSTFSTNLTLGQPDGSCGQPKDCQVYEPLVQQVGEESMVPFFKTDVGRVILRYMVLCCNFDHPVLSSAVSAVPNLKVCGYPAPSAAVDIQKQGAWPWLVLFGEYGGGGKEFYRRCLGTLISHRHVLSTYSCFSSSLVGPTTARLGAYDIESVDMSNEFAVQKVVSYPNASWEDSDIVIVTLDRPVTFSDYIRPACLPFDLRHEAFIGEDLVVVGYGNPLEGVGSVVPRAVHLPVVDWNKCHQRYAPIKNNKITDRVICILETSDVPCNGDSGAPVNYFDPESRKYYVVGFASFSVGCQNPTVPGIYTKVGSYLKWIQDSM